MSSKYNNYGVKDFLRWARNAETFGVFETYEEANERHLHAIASSLLAIATILDQRLPRDASSVTAFLKEEDDE